MTTSVTTDILIIGAGLSGLSTAQFLKKAQPDAHITILEKSNRVGGAIQTFQKDGFTAEWGAHGFLDNCAETNELLDDRGLTDQILRAPLKDFSRYICLGGKLRKLPQSPPSAILSNVIHPEHKLRILAELWKKPITSEQTVAAWVAHRFGRALLPFADAVATGTYAGDIDQLSIDAIMPQLREKEKKYGSIIWSFLGTSLHLSADRSPDPSVTVPANAKMQTLPAMLSFETGLESLCTSLSQGFNIQFNQTVQTIRRNTDHWEVFTDRATHQSQHVIVATNINAALSLLGLLLPPPVQKIPEARLVNVVLGFDASVSIPRAFGYLAPEQEKRFALGTMFSSKMFLHRAPHDMILLETLVGGRRHPERCDLSDDELIQGVLIDLAELLNIKTEPLFAHILRPQAGIPQLEMGHSRLWAYKKDLETKFSGLNILGFGWHGIGINDMTKEAKHIASRIAGRNTDGEEKVKAVYF